MTSNAPPLESASQREPNAVWGARKRMFDLACWIGLIIAVGVYCTLAPRTASRANDNKDFSHLWLGGRMVATGQGAHLYDPQLQEQAYRNADPEGRPPAVWLERNQIVGGFFYPPPTAVAYAPLCSLPMSTAAVVMAFLNIALALLFAWLASRFLTGACAAPHGTDRAAAQVPRPCGSTTDDDSQRERPDTALNSATAGHTGARGPLADRGPGCFALLGLALFVYPAYFVTVSLGQNSAITLLLITAGWLLCSRDRDFAAGLVLGLLVYKPNWLVAVGWIPLIHRRWRLLAGMACAAAAVVMATAALLGAGPFTKYAELVQRLSALQEMPGYNLDLTYNGLSVFRKWFGTGGAADLFGWLSAAGVALVTWWATRGRWLPASPIFKDVTGCCLAAILWVNPHLFYYDLLLTVVLVGLMLSSWSELNTSARLLAVLLAIISYAAIPWDDDWSLKHVIPIPSFVTLAMWLWFIMRTRRGCPRPGEIVPSWSVGRPEFRT